MEKNSIDIVISNLKNLIQSCQEMHEILKNDLSLFGKKDFAAIDKSNFRKVEILNHVHSVMADIGNTHDEKIINKLLKKLDEAKQLEIKDILAKLKEEALNCYKYIMTNSHFVFSNMQHIKETCDLLLESQREMEAVYDQNGNKVK